MSPIHGSFCPTVGPRRVWQYGCVLQSNPQAWEVKCVDMGFLHLLVSPVLGLLCVYCFVVWDVSPRTHLFLLHFLKLDRFFSLLEWASQLIESCCLPQVFLQASILFFCPILWSVMVTKFKLLLTPSHSNLIQECHELLAGIHSHPT